MRTQAIFVGASIPLLLASSTLAEDIQIWSNEAELENGNTIIIDADDTGGDVTLQFGNTLGESLTWDNANTQFNLSDTLNIEGDISLDGNVVMQTGATVDGVDVSELDAANTALEARVTTNEGNITTNQTNITTNTGSIATNTTDIATLEAEQTTQNKNISTNAADIATLETLSGDGDFTGATYITFGNTLTEALLELDTQINTNATTIAQNASDIADIQTEQTTQNTNISTNATDIATLETEQTTQNTNISTNATDIATLETLSGDGDFTGATYITFGNTLTEAILELDTQINTNATTIAQNTSDIADIQTEQTTQNTNISTNATDIATLETEQTTQNNDIDALELQVGDTDFSTATTITNGNDITEALLELDAQIDSNKPETYTVPLGSVVIRGDGSNNIVNIFRSTENGTDPHHYHKVIASNGTLQDIELEHKVKVFEDSKALDKVSFFYKTDAGATDSKIDVTVTDSAGNVLATQSNLSGTSWTEATLDISATTPTVDEFIYVTFTGYSRAQNATLVGDIALHYGEER